MTKNEREFLFYYLREGDKSILERNTSKFQLNEPDDRYKTNVFEIVRFLLEYGFIPPLLEAQAAADNKKSFGAFWKTATSGLATITVDDEYHEAQRVLSGNNNSEG